MRVTIDFGDGVGARDYSAWVLDGSGATAASLGVKAAGFEVRAAGVEVVRKLNKPSELKLGLLVRSAGAVVEPPIGATVEVVRSSAEKLFTGAVADIAYEYLGWGEQGGVYAMNVLALSSEANSTQAAIPGGLTESGGLTAAQVLAAQAAGLAIAVGNDGGVTEAIELPVVEFGPETSAAKAIASVAAQARLSYRVHDGQLTIVPVGAVTHTVTNAQNQDPQVVMEAQSAAQASKKKTGVTTVGRSEAQAYVVEYRKLDGTTSAVATGRPVYDHTSRKTFEDLFAGGKTALAVTGQTSAVVVGNGLMSVNATAQCAVAVGAPVECGGRVLLEIDGCAIASAGAAALMGFFDASFPGTPVLGNCVAGFEMTPSGGSTQVNAVIRGAVTGTAMTVNATSKYAFRVRMYAPAHVRKTQVYHGAGNPAGSGLGGRNVPSWISVVCEATETMQNGTKRVWMLGAGQSAASPSYANAVVVSGTSMAMSIGKVRVARGPALDARYVSGGVERVLRMGTKADGAEAWISKGDVVLGFAPASGDVLKLRYRMSGTANASAGSGAGAVPGAQGLTRMSVEAPAARCTEDCENAAAAIVADASNPAALTAATLTDTVATLGTDVWPGDTVTVDGLTGVVRQVVIRPVSMRADAFATQMKLENDGVNGIAIQATETGGSLTAARSVAGTAYAPDLDQAVITSIDAGNMYVDAGALTGSDGVEVRTTEDGWGQSGAGLVTRSSAEAFTLGRTGTVDEFYLKQFDGSGAYSREAVLVRVGG